MKDLNVKHEAYNYFIKMGMIENLSRDCKRQVANLCKFYAFRKSYGSEPIDYFIGCGMIENLKQDEAYFVNALCNFYIKFSQS